MRHSILSLTFLLSSVLQPAPSFAADAKWVHATSEHFDMYTAESEGDAKAALQHLEAVRAYFLAATHSKDPGSQPVRIVAFHSAGDYSKYRPQEVGSARAYAQQGAVPATIAVEGLKPEIYEQIFREYAQLVMDEYSPSLPYWLRAGLADLYSTLKPGENQIKLGIPPVRDYRSSGIADVDLNIMFEIDRAGLLAARNLQGTATHAEPNAQSAAFGRANASQTNALAQTQTALAQDYGGAIWMLTHMIMFQPDYRPKFGEFVSTLGTGQPTGATFSKVYGRSVGQVAVDLKLYAKQPSLSSANLPFKYEKPAAPQIQPAAKEEQDRILADLSRKTK
jgi:hypothetical protein